MQVAQPQSGRRNLRVARSVAQVVQIEDGMGFPFRNHGAEIEDIGIGGIGLKMRCTALRGDRIRVVLTEPASGQTMRFQAIVRWRGGEHFGLQWVNLSPQQQSWLRSLLRFWAVQSAMPVTREAATLGLAAVA